MNKYIPISLGIGAGVLLLIMKGSSLGNMAKNLTYKIRLNGKPKLYAGGVLTFITSVVAGGSGSRLRLPIAIDFENRSDEEITIGVNALFIYYKGTKLASNGVTPSSVTIKKYATSTMEGLNLDVEVSSLIQVAGSAVTSWLSNEDFSNLTKDITIQLSAVINNALVLNLERALNQETTVSTDSSTQTNTVQGLGLVASKERAIKSIGDYIAYIPTKDHLLRQDKIVIPDGSVRNTADLMHTVVNNYYTDVTELAGRLKMDTLKATLQNIFNFVYTYIKYVPDSRVREQVRRPLRTLYDQQGDCDCYATLIASILKNLGIAYRFRIAAYSAGRYQHVYVIVPTTETDKGYYVVDPVLDKCFEEKTPSKFFDV